MQNNSNLTSDLNLQCCKDSNFKEIGRGSGVKFSCEAHIKLPIAGVSALFTECQNFARSGKYGSFNFHASILFYSKI